MNASRLVRRPLVSLLLVVLVSGLAWATVEYFYQDAYERALAQSEYLIQNERIDSLDTLIARLTAIQFGGLPPMPGAEPWEHSEGPLPVDWENFPKELQDGLVGYWEDNVPVYDLHIWQDRQTREIVIQNSDFIEICTLPCPYAEYCQPETYALYLRPDLYSGKYSQRQIADFVAERDPARVGLHVTLVPTANLFEYLYAKASQQSLLEGLMEQGGGSQMMMSQGGGSGVLNDLDGDGVPNREEILAGTNPEDASDYLRITNLQLVAGIREIWWPTASNRQYTVMTSTGGVALLSPQSWSVATQWLDGTGSGIVFTDTLSDIDVAFHHIQVRETDSNTNDLPDWWEIEHFGGLTNILATGDEDGDGLDNLEELYYGYSPTNSERTLYHSGFHVVEVPTNSPNPDDGTEEFDFHAAGRPLSLASGATNADWGNNIPTVYGASYSFSGGIFFNNDLSNLYVGICGLERGADNAFVLFLDSGTGGVTNLAHLSGRPYALGIADNVSFNAAQFTPNVAIIVGDNRDDGSNNIYRTIGGNDVGQGVYELSSSTNIADFTGFSRTSGGAPFSQWSIDGSAGDSPNAGVEVTLSLAALGVEPGDTIRATGVFLGGTSGSNRWVVEEAYGETFSGSGFNPVTLIGSPVKLASAWQTLPPDTYPGFTDDDVMLQGFYWDVKPVWGWWTNLCGKVADVSQSGFTLIWLPPPYKAANAGYSVGYDPFDHYDLGEYNQRGFIQTRYGTKAELTNLLAALISTNILPVCDIVLNHMAGGSGGDHKTFDYPHNIFEKGSTNFHPSSTGHNDEIFPYHNNENFGTYPPLDIYGVDNDLLDPHMRRGLKQWGSWLVTNIHFGGFRFDYTEGVEPWYVWEWLNYPSQRPLFGFMEYWANANAVEMRTWLHLTGWEAAIYDWNLQKLLEGMCEDSGTSFDMSELQAPSLLGVEAGYTVTFVENHDTLQPPDETGIATNKQLAYAYIMHSQGLPLVFYHDYYDQPYYVGGTNYAGVPLKPEIDRLILIRKATVAGRVAYLNTNADLFIQQRDGGGRKPGSILVINDHPSSTLTNQVQTVYTNQWLIDLVSSNQATLIQTDTNGYVNLAAPPRDYRIYGLTNSITE